MKITQLCPTLCNPRILQARILEWVAFPFSRGSSQPKDWTQVSWIEPRSPTLQGNSLPAEPQGKPKYTRVGSLSLLQRILLTQESNWGLLHCRWILYQLSYEGSTNNREDEFCEFFSHYISPPIIVRMNINEKKIHRITLWPSGPTRNRLWILRQSHFIRE